MVKYDKIKLHITDNKSVISSCFVMLFPTWGGGNSPVTFSKKSELQYFRDVFYMS